MPPIGKQKKYPALTLIAIHAKERGKPDNHDAIDWKLMTDLPISTDEAAVEKLNCDKFHSELANIFYDDELTPTEIQLLDYLVAAKSSHSETKKSIKLYYKNCDAGWLFCTQ